MVVYMLLTLMLLPNSYSGRLPQAVLCLAEAEKKFKYMEACLALHTGFILVFFYN